MDETVSQTQAWVAAAREAVVTRHGVSPGIEAQHDTHGLAWMATLAAGIEAVRRWAERRAGHDRDIAELAIVEARAQLAHGVAIGPNESFRPASLGLEFAAPPPEAPLRRRVADALLDGRQPDDSSGDATLDAVRAQYRRYADERILPHAHGWHLADALIPDAVVDDLAAMGTFGVTVAEAHGGLGLGKLAMCIVSEELSRGWIAAGSLGTRSEIAAELIATGGTDAQREQWLPRIASGAVLPAAVFTEPDVGSDLASVATRARPSRDGWRIDGAKTWSTHAVRSDLMTLLARTSDAPGYAGLSMFLAAKPRGSDAAPFPAPGMSGSEIAVLGYRGMREYALQFDGFEVCGDGLLGGEEGRGFKQLMQTFESARIQTAARAVGVARRAFEVARTYALDRRQFGRPIAHFPRVADKLAMMAAEILMARELAYAAGLAKDEGRRCDIEAGMAKLYAARVAWSCADAAVQIHGGNGYALEYEASRLLCDARVLTIFEGAAEIQAEVIARGLLREEGA